MQIRGVPDSTDSREEQKRVKPSLSLSFPYLIHLNMASNACVCVFCYCCFGRAQREAGDAALLSISLEHLLATILPVRERLIFTFPFFFWFPFVLLAVPFTCFDFLSVFLTYFPVALMGFVLFSSLFSILNTGAHLQRNCFLDMQEKKERQAHLGR